MRWVHSQRHPFEHYRANDEYAQECHCHASTYAYAEPLDIYVCVQERAAITPKVKAFMNYLTEYLEVRWPMEGTLIAEADHRC